MPHRNRTASVIVFAVILLSVTACTRSIVATDGGPPFCLVVTEPIRASDADTQETLDQVAVVNGLWEHWCE